MSNAPLDPPPHQIRLRAAWEYVPSGGRVDLPADWPPAQAQAPFQIARRFGRPSFNPAAEIVCLRLQSITGLVKATMNDTDLVAQAVTGDHADPPLKIPVRLLSKNLLTLTIDPSCWMNQPHLARNWGNISLSIEPIPSGPAADPLDS